MTKFAKLAALGAWGVVSGLLAVFALFVVFLTRPNGTGMDRSEAWVGWISVGCVVAALVWVHGIFARILTEMAKGRRSSIESSW